MRNKAAIWVATQIAIIIAIVFPKAMFQMDFNIQAWDKRKQIMCDVLNINFDAGVVHIKDQKTNLYWGRKFEDVELLQYTGQKDAYDTEIFDGILTFNWLFLQIYIETRMLKKETPFIHGASKGNCQVMTYSTK